MSSINSISSNLLQSYINYQSKKELTPQNMFQMLSIQLGGDGETITKKQLDSYIESANNGKIKISDAELNALTLLQDKWDTISGGKDSIKFGDMASYTTLLATIITSGIATSEDAASSDSSMSTTEEIYAYLIDSAFKAATNDNSDDNSSTDAASLLQTLLEGTTDIKDDSNSELIATLINFIADLKSASTVNTQV